MSFRRSLFAASLCCLAAAAVAQDLPANLPKRKPGLWEMQTAGMGAGTQTSKICLDESTDQAMYKMGSSMRGRTCSKFAINMVNGVVVSDTACSLQGPNGAVNMTSHSETTFDGNTAYRTEGNVTYDPAVMGMSSMKVSTSGHWVGQCEAGQKPGDMVMPNGQTMNVHDMMQQ